MGRLITRTSFVPDTTPTAFTFVDQTDVATDSTITSAAITVNGINTASPISVSGGTYDINSSGSFTSSPGTVTNGQTVRARHTSSALGSAPTDTIVTIGGVSDTFRSTTIAPGGGSPDDTPTLWVAIGGDDSRTKATVAGSAGTLPWATLGRAVWGNANRATPSAAQAAAAGDVVGVGAGTYTTAGFNASDIAYNPANDGTSTDPIVFQADGEVILNLSSPGSAIGGFGNQWITWRGFTLDDDANPQFFADGVVHVENSNGITLENLIIRGRNEDTLDGDQYCAIFWTDVEDLTIRNCLMDGFGGGLDGSGIADSDENASGITGYFQSNRVLVEHNEIYRCGSGWYHKGVRDGAGPPYGTGPVTFRYNIIGECKRGIRQYVANHTEALPCPVYQNIIRDCVFGGIESIWFGSPDADSGNHYETRYVQFVNNTIYNCGTQSGEGRAIYIGDYPASSFIEFKNNIIVNGEWAYMSPGTDIASNAIICNRNQINNVSVFSYINATNTNIASWRTLTDQDADTITTAPTFTNAAADDYTLVSNGQAALTLGRVVHSIGGTDGNTIPVGAYITGTEEIGIEA